MTRTEIEEKVRNFLIEDLETNGFPWESPNLFPVLLALKPSLSRNFIHSLVLSLTEFFWNLCAPIEIPEITQISVDPQIVETGKKILEFLSNSLQFDDFDIRPICANFAYHCPCQRGGTESDTTWRD